MGKTGRNHISVRIWCKGNTLLGTGFLISDREFLTCAHVVQGHENEIQVDFPLLAKKKYKVIIKKIYKVDEHAGIGDIEDIAVLELHPDEFLNEKARPAPVFDIDPQEFYNRKVSVLGFPAKIKDGYYVDGVLKGPQAKGWVQIEHQDPNRTILPGYSGAPVWDLEGKGVVGMVVATRSISAYMIPGASLKEAAPIFGGKRQDDGAKKVKLGSLVSKMCNRGPHDEMFSSSFEKNCKCHPKQPQVYVIHGCGSGCHESLIERLRYTCINKFFIDQPQKTGFQKPHNIPLEFEGNFETRKAYLRRQVARSIEISYTDEEISLMELVRLSGLNRQCPVILFTHNIPAIKWDPEYERLISWYVNHFLNVNAGYGSAPQIIIFFTIIYPEAGRLKRIFRTDNLLKNRIIRRLEMILNAKESACQYIIIEELSEIEPVHVNNWFSQYCNWMGMAKRRKIISDIFGGRKTQCMADVECKLEQIILERTRII